MIFRLDHDLSFSLVITNMVQANTILGDQGAIMQSGDWGLKKWRNNSSLPTVMTAPAFPPNA